MKCINCRAQNIFQPELGPETLESSREMTWNYMFGEVELKNIMDFSQIS